jgi:hypothetical protein
MAGGDDVLSLLATALGAGLAVAAAASGAVLVARRLALPAAEPLPAAVTLGVAILGAAVVAGSDVASRCGPRQAWTAVATRVGLVLALLAVAAPFRAVAWTDAATLALAVAIAVVAVIRRPGPPAAPRRVAAASRPPAAARSPRAERQFGGHLRQRFARYDTRSGADCLRGRINIELDAGARTAHGHVGFCPAFPLTPTVKTTTDYDGVEASVTAAEVLPWGVRVEVRLAEPAEEPLEIPVDLVVRCPG